MSGYALFLLHGYRVLEVHEIDASNEGAAIQLARLRAAGRSFELWRKEQRIASFHAEDDLYSVLAIEGDPQQFCGNVTGSRAGRRS